MKHIHTIILALSLSLPICKAYSQESAPAPNPTPGNLASYTENANGVAFDFVLVEGGSFKMGSNESNDEKPIHTVTLSSYYMGETEVTQAQWREVMGTNPSNNKGCDNCAVEQVNGEDIQAFLKKLNQQTGKNYRLPREAEWEYAARGGTLSKGYKYSGSDDLARVAWYVDNAGHKTHPVKGKDPNELGLYDMTGNVWEWCQDWYDADYYKNSPSSNPQNTNLTNYRVVLRGGSWECLINYCRVSYRNAANPDNGGNYKGFRLARDL